MGPLSRLIPKELLPVRGLPILGWVLLELRSAGVREIHLVTSPEKPLLRTFVEQAPSLLGGKWELHLWNQNQDRAGNYGAVLSVPTEVRRAGPYILVWGDEIFDSGRGQRSRAHQLIAAHHRLDRPVVGVTEVEDQQVNICGVIETDSEHRIHRVLEKPSPSDTTSRLALVGGAVVSPCLDEWLAEQAPSRPREAVFAELLATWPQLETVGAEVLEAEWWELGSIASYRAGAMSLEARGVEFVEG